MRMVVEDTAKTKQGLDSLYRRLVTLVVLRSGLGNPTDATVIQEGNSCLATVFPVSQLVAFQPMARILNSASEATAKNLANLDSYAREKGYKLTAAFEKLIYTDAGMNAANKDIDQVRKEFGFVCVNHIH